MITGKAVRGMLLVGGTTNRAGEQKERGAESPLRGIGTFSRKHGI